MNLEVTGRLEQFLPPQTGVKKDGSGNWIKQSFLVATESEYNNLYCFEVFGDEKVQNLTKYQKEGDNVTVEFNVNTNEYKGNFYTTLSAWKISKQGGLISPDNKEFSPPAIEVEDTGLPF